MSEDAARVINLVEDFYQGLLEMQEFADAHGGRGRQLVNALMNFAYQIVAAAPRAYPVYPVAKYPRENIGGLSFARNTC